MAEVVLGDIVARLRIDNAQFEQALNQAQQRLQQLNQSLNQSTQQQSADRQATQQLTQAMVQLTQATTNARTSAQSFNQTLNQTNNTFHQTTTIVRETAAATQQASGAFRAMLQVAGGIGIATGISALVGQMKDFAASTVDVATRMQSLRASLAALGGSAQAGQQQFAQLFQTAQALGVAFEPLARGFRSLTAAATQAGLPLADQQRLLTALATESRRVGASNEEVGRAITALSQVASKGKVSMEELRQQLGEAIPTALAAAAKGMGVTTEALTKMVETGTLDFVPFAKALTRGFEEMQQASGAFAGGARQAFNQLGNAFLAFKDSLGANILPEMERLAKIATGILDTATALLNLAGGRRDPRLAPNTAQEVQGTPQQEREIQALRTVIANLERQIPATVAGPLREQREGQLQRAKEQLDTLLEVIQATKDQTAAESAANAERNKALSLTERQTAFNERLQKALEAVRKEDAAFREQARNAPNVLGDPRGTPEQQETFARARQKALETAVENLTKVISPEARGEGVTVTKEQTDAIRTLDLESKQYGDTIDALKEKERERRRAETEAEQARKRAAREAQQDAEQYQEAIDKVRIAIVQQQEDALSTLQRLAASYGQTSEARDIDTATKAAAVLADTALNDQAQAYLKTITDVAKVEAQLPELRRQAEASRRAGMEAVAGGTADTAFRQNLRDQLERLQAPREERLELRLRAQARKQGIVPDEALEGQFKAIGQQERFNQLMEVTSRLGDSVAQNLTNGLLTIASGAERVGVAFQAMAKAILDSVSQIAVSEGFKMLLALGVRAIGAYFAPTTAATGVLGGGTTLGGSSGAVVGGALGFQHGGIVTKPTLAVIGENAATRPEYVLNRQQMASMMQSAREAGPSAGGQAMGGAHVSVINVASRSEAEQRAAQERALGRQVVINYVMDELSQGSGSRIAQVLRAGQR